MRLRPVLFWIHLTAGAVAGIVILIMSVTGVLLTYEKQMLWWADTSQYRALPAPSQSRLPIESLLDSARKAFPDAEPTVVAMRSDPAAPAAVTIGQRIVYVNPYTGAVWGTGSTRVRQFFRLVTEWHRYLGASGGSRATGKLATGICNLAFLVLVCSGVVLWWPRIANWRQVRNVLWFRRGLSAKARDFNWHNTIGFWTSVPLFVVVLSATVISFPWASNLVYRIVGEQPPAPAGRPAAEGSRAGRPSTAGAAREGSQPARPVTATPAAGFDALWVRAEQQVAGWTIISARMPAAPTAPIVFTIDRGNGGQPQKRGTLTLDGATGTIVRWEAFQDTSRGRQLRSWLRFAHTGEAFGTVGQTIAGIASLGGAFLVWTGLALAIRRLFAAVRRSRQVPAPGRAIVAD